jgi:pimeloyl-ACP methyl ester carboxylesterase
LLATALEKNKKIPVSSPAADNHKLSKTPHFKQICPEQAADLCIFELADNRRLAYSIYGKPDGYPVFYFHSTGSSRIECRLFHSSAKRLGYQLIAIDRPGIGYSDFKAHLQMNDVADDVLALANELKLERFGLMSFATGGIFALSMAYSCPQRVAFQLSLGGIPGVLLHGSNQKSSYFSDCIRFMLPSVVRQFTRFKHKFTMDSPTARLERLSEVLNYTDKKVLTDPEVKSIIKSSMTESIRQGFQGIAQDKGLSYTESEIELKHINVPVFIWQGCADNLQPTSSSAYLAARIPTASFHSVANRGHFFFIHCMDEIFKRTKSIVHA